MDIEAWAKHVGTCEACFRGGRCEEMSFIGCVGVHESCPPATEAEWPARAGFMPGESPMNRARMGEALSKVRAIGHLGATKTLMTGHCLICGNSAESVILLPIVREGREVPAAIRVLSARSVARRAR